VSPILIVEKALESVKFHAERKKIKINTEISSALPNVKADLEKTTWVLINLLTNAIRHTPENDSIQVWVTSKKSAVEFSVIDTGTGIEQKYLPKLFDKFFQVPGTPSGSGLGLAISKEFIEAQSGQINVVSSLGKGSNFSFQLPHC
jgi:signal transduction histidine kinase